MISWTGRQFLRSQRYLILEILFLIFLCNFYNGGHSVILMYWGEKKIYNKDYKMFFNTIFIKKNIFFFSNEINGEMNALIKLHFSRQFEEIETKFQSKASWITHFILKNKKSSVDSSTSHMKTMNFVVNKHGPLNSAS